MEAELYKKLLTQLDNLEISLDTEEWFYIHDDILQLKEICNEFNSISNEFYLFKFKEQAERISFLESEARDYLKDFNIII